MYCNLTRSQGFPMAIRVSLQQTTLKSCFQSSKSSYLPVKFHLNPKGRAFANVSTGLVSSRLNSMKIGMLRNPESVREFSSFDSQRFGKRSSNSSRGKSGLGSKAFRDKRSGGNGRSSGDSIWVKSDEKPVEERFQRGDRPSWEKRDGRSDSVSDNRSRFRGYGETRIRDSFRGRRDDRISEVEEESKKGSGNSIWVANDDKPAKEQLPRVNNRSSWDDRTRNQNSFSARGDDRIAEEVEDETMNHAPEDGDEIVEEEPDNTRWSEIKNRFNRYDVRDQGRDSAAYRNWNRQESWGRKTWQEATESSVPRLEGEVVYGVSPVLAALSVGRREFYALYVQEGLDLSSNNRKKKDKKGFEKVLKISEKLGLNVKETSKHDLNMVADNRPHQGLVLDASPLELVKVKELDPISSEEEKYSLWVALDEVTDPQNLGAIIRSAYFFGATGVVVCAKNSAPLSAVVSKASAGSLEVMELRYCKNMMQFLEASAENGWRVVGGSVSPKAVALNEVLPGSPTILVLGNEGTGLRPLVERSCTELVRISGNMPNDVAVTESDDAEGEGFRSFLAVESLNVSVAAGLFLHHLIGNKASA
ncbi:50S ribosomal protein L30e-like [Arabidopsis thaliana x Arabidopsis arenosa]|uniref:rRNA methyltransferase 1, mitochondrial n=1 Tax=Arabidopsis thaliana x Arabidopsis arenosa TaxID=1240361 RepID=A0A8T2B780_9BRAS|nr:50S ribosomal protein L30e-like [Arabidopsis thaliana x Arabidopsis arenosa]